MQHPPLKEVAEGEVVGLVCVEVRGQGGEAHGVPLLVDEALPDQVVGAVDEEELQLALDAGLEAGDEGVLQQTEGPRDGVLPHLQIQGVRRFRGSGDSGGQENKEFQEEGESEPRPCGVRRS